MFKFCWMSLTLESPSGTNTKALASNKAAAHFDDKIPSMLLE